MASLKKWLDRQRNPWRGVFYDAFNAWKKDRAYTRLYNYSETPTAATIFDFGAFRGDWTEMVLTAQPNCTVHMFEPHPAFAEELCKRYENDSRVTLHNCALGSADGTLNLSDAGDASSAITFEDKGINASVISAARFFAEHDIPHIDLAKINIEGGEYDLIPALIDSGVIQRIDRLQVQFHLFEPQHMRERDAIRERLKETHHCTWEYPFVWEEWGRTS